MTDNHTIELDPIQARWLLDAIRWSKEHSQENGHRRNANKLSKLEDSVKEQLPSYAELADSI